MGIKLKLMIMLTRWYIKIVSIFSITKAAQIAFRIFSTPFRKARPFKPAIFDTAENISICVDGYMLYGYIWGKENNSKALVVHGFESRAYNFEKYVSALIDLGYGVIAMDAKAHGKSEGKTIVLPEYIAMMKQLETLYGKFDVFLGHSFGGLAISLFNEENPHPGSKLVLIAPATETSTAIHMFCQFLKINKSIELQIQKLIQEKAGVPVDFYSVRRAMQHIHSQTLWIHDLQDDITPYSDAKKVMDAHYPHVKFITTTGLGHRRIYRDQEVMRQIFEFIGPSK